MDPDPAGQIASCVAQRGRKLALSATLHEPECLRAELEPSQYLSWPADQSGRLERSGRIGSWHLPVGQNLLSLCEALNHRCITYAVLPTIASVHEREPIELLVSDDDIPRLADLITRVPLGHQLAIYSATGMPGFSFQQRWRHINDGTNMALLPSYLADALLERVRVDDRKIRIPSANDMLLWVIYRALYLSGNTHFAVSSLDEQSPILIGPATKIIKELARETAAKLTEPFTLEELDQHLSASGWEPPFDLLRRISCWNSWAALKAVKVDAPDASEGPGLAVFFIRREVLAHGLQSDISSALEGNGFELLQTIDLTEEQIAAATRSFRGGDWGPGSSPISGGPPVRLIIAFDVLPNSLPEQMRYLYPHMDNGRIFRVKEICRQLIQRGMPPNHSFNPMHSTDTSGEAWRAVRMFSEADEQRLRAIAESRQAEMATHFEVVRDLTRKGNRAKIELIRYRGQLAVKKTFRHTCLHYLEREATFMNVVSPERPEVLPVLERGHNYFIAPFVDGPPLRRVLFGRAYPKLMTFRQVRNLADLMQFLFSRGFDPVDFAPYNLLIDNSGNLRAIDFEFVHRSDAPVQPESSACFSGITEEFAGEWTPSALWEWKRSHADPYYELWFGHTGLTLRSFLYDPPSLQLIKRIPNYVYFLGRRAAQRGKQVLRERTKRTLRRRLPVLTRAAVHAFRSNAK